MYFNENDVRQQLQTVLQELSSAPDSKQFKLGKYYTSPVKGSDAALKVVSQQGHFLAKAYLKKSGLAAVNRDKHDYNSIRFIDLFFQEWNQQGVVTPTIQCKYISPYNPNLLVYIFDYIDHNRFPGDSQSLSQERIFEIGKTLARMHQTKADYLGYPVGQSSLQGSHLSFSRFLDSFLENQGLFPLRALPGRQEDRQLLEQSICFLDRQLRQQKSCFCHCDYALRNILLTDPLVILDPSPLLLPAELDLALAITAMGNENDACYRNLDIFLAGYGEYGLIDKELLWHALIWATQYRMNLALKRRGRLAQGLARLYNNLKATSPQRYNLAAVARASSGQSISNHLVNAYLMKKSQIGWLEQRQKGVCKVCNQDFKPYEWVETYPRNGDQPDVDGKNLILVHNTCLQELCKQQSH